MKKLAELHGRKKLEYLVDYYKFPFIVACILIYIVGYTIHGHFAKKQIVIYEAGVNVTFGENLEHALGDSFIDYLNVSPKKNTYTLYKDLYLTADTSSTYYEYTYASKIKILAAIDAKQLDVVIMDKEAYDAFSEQGYLCDLNELLYSSDELLYESLSDYLIENDGVLNGIDVTKLTVFGEASFDDNVYMGVIENSPRKEIAVNYLHYLFVR
jgi:hypothetical protein